jgi:hypothetical protein
MPAYLIANIEVAGPDGYRLSTAPSAKATSSRRVDPLDAAGRHGPSTETIAQLKRLADERRPGACCIRNPIRLITKMPA